MDALDRYSVANLFTGDIFTSEQWADQNVPNLTPEKNLLLAILQDVISLRLKLWDKTDQYSVRILREAEEWILSDATRWGSFRHCATHLGFDVSYLRRGLQRQEMTDGMKMNSRKYVGRGTQQVVKVTKQSHTAKG